MTGEDQREAGTRFCPYPGLDAFTEEYRPYFVGRKRDTELLISNLYAAPLTILYGASGVGKTSVLLAGVVPRIKEAKDAIVVVHRTWQSEALVRSLGVRIIEAVDAHLGRPTGVDPRLPLDEIVEGVSRHWRGSLLLLFDQFEEYFLYPADRTSSTGFDAAFARAVNRRELQVNFLISLREDSLSGLDRFRHRIPTLLSNLYRLEHLSGEDVRRAIREPLATLRQLHPEADVPTAIEPELVDAIVADQVAFEQGGHGGEGSGQRTPAERFETPFLQLALRRLWLQEMREHSPGMRLVTFERLGRATGIVQLRISESLGDLPPADQRVAASMLRYLVTPSGAKIALGVADLASYVGASTDGVRAAATLLAAQDRRILRTVPHPSGDPEKLRFEIFHDALARPLLDWRVDYDRDLAAESERRKAAESAAAREQELRASSRRSLVRLAAGAVLFMALAIVAVVVLTLQADRRQSDARTLSALAANKLTSDKDLAILLALEALKVDPGVPESEVTLRQALFEPGEIADRPLPQQPDALGLSRDGRWLLGTSASGLAVVVDTAKLDVVTPILADTFGITAASFSPDSRFAVLALRDGSVRVLEAGTWKEVARFPGSEDSTFAGVAASAGGDTIHAAHGDGGIRRWTRNGGQYSSGVAVTLAQAGPSAKLLLTPQRDRFLRADELDPAVVLRATGDLANAIDAPEPRVDHVFFTAGPLLVFQRWDTANVRLRTVGKGSGLRDVPLACVPNALDVARTRAIALVGCEDGALVTMNLAEDTPGAKSNEAFVVGRLPGHHGRFSVVEVSDDGRFGFTVGVDDGLAVVWDLKEGREQMRLKGLAGTEIKARFLRSNSHLITIDEGPTMRVWALTSAAENFPSGRPPFRGSRLAPNDSLVAAAYDDELVLWRRGGGSTHFSVADMGGGGIKSGPAFAPDGRAVGFVRSDDAVRELPLDGSPPPAEWIVRSERPGGRSRRTRADYLAAGSLSRVEYSPDGRFATAVISGGIQYTRSGRERSSETLVALLWRDSARTVEMLRHEDGSDALAISQDSRQVAFTGPEGAVRLYDVAQRRSQAIDDSPRTTPAVDSVRLRSPTTLLFSPTGDLASSGGDSSVVVRHPHGKVRQSSSRVILTGHRARVGALAFDTTGTLLASGDGSGVVMVWDVEEGTARCRLDGEHTDSITALAFAPSGRVLTSASRDASAIVWALDERGTCRVLYRITGSSEPLESLAFGKDGAFLVIGDIDGNIRRFGRAFWAPRDSIVARALVLLNGRVLTPRDTARFLK